MQLQNHPQQQDIFSDADFWASTDDVTYPIEDKLRNANFAVSRISSKIQQADSTWKHVSSNSTTIPIDTTDLVAGQDNYSFKTSHLKILRVRVKGSDGIFKTLKAIDRRKVSDDILNASGEPEFYDKVGFSLMIMPVPNYGAVDGLEIEHQPGADLFVLEDEEKEPGFNPDFHRLVSLYMAKDYCALHNPERVRMVIMPELMAMEKDLLLFISARDIDDEPSFTVKKSNNSIGLLT